MERMVSLSEGKARLFELVKEAAEREIWLLRYGRPAGVLLSADRYEALLEEIEDLKDRLSVYESRETPPDMRIPWQKAKVELGLE